MRTLPPALALVTLAVVACVGPVPSPSASPRRAGSLAPSTEQTLEPTESPSQEDEPTPVPTAPAIALQDPCTADDVSLAGRSLGAAAGSAAVAVTVRNETDRPCDVGGYPRIVLLAADGTDLPTVWRPALDGAMLFPAVVAVPVRIAPGATATIAIGFSDNPFGPNADLPYGVACPASAGVRVFAADGTPLGVASVASAPCNGVIDVSPFVRGPDPPRY